MKGEDGFIATSKLKLVKRTNNQPIHRREEAVQGDKGAGLD